MASYPAPTETLPIFSPSVFDVNDVPLTITEGEKYFITYPTAQGAITIPTLSTGTLNVSGTLTSTLNSHNLGFGYQALAAKVDGSAIDNTAFGFQALAALTLGDSNTAIGDLAFPIMTGTSALTKNNTAVGHQAGRYLLDGTDNTFVGFNAGAGTSSHSGSNFNTCVGSGAGSGFTTGDNNTLVGAAIDVISSGSNNTGLGYNLIIGTSGTYRTCIGSGSVGTINNCVTLGRVGTDSVKLNKITPMYTTPSLVSGDIGFIESRTITYPGTTTNIIASNISANGTWVVYVFLSFTLLTTSPKLIVQDATPTTLGVVSLKNTSGTDRYIGSFPYTITAAANVVSIRLSLAPTSGGLDGADANQYVRFVRIA